MEKRFSHKRITELRETWGLTISEFARKIGKSRQLVSSWETGASRPQLDSLVELCAVFDVPLEFFVVKNDVSAHQNNSETHQP